MPLTSTRAFKKNPRLFASAQGMYYQTTEGKKILDGVITVQSNYLVMQTKNDGATNIYNTGRYLDKIEVDGDELKFKEKTVVFDTHQIQSLLVTPI